MRHLLCVVLLAVVPVAGSPEARTWNVSPDGLGDAPTIQAGIDSAAVGDTVLLGCGTYFEHDIEAKPGICISSESGDPNCAILDAGFAGRGIHCSTFGEPSWIVGLTVRNGAVSGSPPSNYGGGIGWHGTSLVVESCAFVGNHAEYGGGLYHSGGFAESLLVIDCTFEGNAATAGGGGLCLLNPEYALLDRVTAKDCSAEGGGALHILTSIESDVFLKRVVFTNNSAQGGGGVLIHGTSPFWTVEMSVDASTFCGNRGMLGSNFWVFRSSVTIENSILAFGSEGPAFYCATGGSGTFSCCDLYGNEGGDWVGCIASQEDVNGNFSRDPLFCNIGAGDLTLATSSPCLPGNHPHGAHCDLIGALGEGCSGPTAVEETSWSGIKSLFR